MGSVKGAKESKAEEKKDKKYVKMHFFNRKVENPKKKNAMLKGIPTKTQEKKDKKSVGKLSKSQEKKDKKYVKMHFFNKKIENQNKKSQKSVPVKKVFIKLKVIKSP